MSVEPAAEITLYARRGRLLLVVVGSCAFVAAGGWVLSREDSAGAQLAAWAAIAFFGLGGAWGVRRLLVPTPVLVVDRAGIVDAASAIAAGRLSWDEIDYVVTYAFGGHRMLGIFVTDLEALRRRLSWWKRKMLDANLRLGCAPVNVPQSVLPMRVDELAQSIDAALRGHRAAP